MDRDEFRRRLEALIAEATAQDMCPLEVSLVLQETYEEIDSGIVIRATPKLKHLSGQ